MYLLFAAADDARSKFVTWNMIAKCLSHTQTHQTKNELALSKVRLLSRLRGIYLMRQSVAKNSKELDLLPHRIHETETSFSFKFLVRMTHRVDIFSIRIVNCAGGEVRDVEHWTATAIRCINKVKLSK